MEPSPTPRSPPPGTLSEVAWLFLKLGSTTFGGPAVHIAMMEDEVVHRRHWLTRAEFLDLVGATNLIPGPNSTELAIHIGHRQAGWPGLLLAGFCFITPATLIVGVLAWAYVRFGRLVEVEGLLYGVKPVIMAVILQALGRLGRTAIKNRALGCLGLLGAAAGLAGVHELLILVAGGCAAAALLPRSPTLPRPSRLVLAPFLAAPGLAAPAAAAGAAPFSLSALFLFFAKVGAVLFGSGYVLLAFLRAQLVERWQWLTEKQLLDAIAVGQFTPGPLFTTATFIGYVLGGVPGAGLATAGIFLPAFVFVAASGPWIPRLRQSATAGAFLDGLNVASLALMAVVTLQLGRAAVVDVTTAALAATSAVLLLRFRINTVWLILAGALAGIATHALRS